MLMVPEEPTGNQCQQHTAQTNSPGRHTSARSQASEEESQG